MEVTKSSVLEVHVSLHMVAFHRVLTQVYKNGCSRRSVLNASTFAEFDIRIAEICFDHFPVCAGSEHNCVV